ncbi:MAG: recombination-associated protein RdgC [Proteobacteria bacterium]|nr:recombination-associated protein RdgC [Pseudomonadota bacterium]
MFKNALVYRIDQWEPPTQADIERRLEAARFAECAPSQPEAAGWVEPRGGKRGGALLESVGGQLILQLCTENKPVPSGVIKQRLEAQLDKIEADTGRRPRGKAKRELKEQIVHELLPRAFPKRSSTLVWIDLEARLALIGATAGKKTDAVVTRLVDLFGGLRLAPLQTALAPASAMSLWLSEKEAPRGFSIDRECELKQPDSEKAAVRYARHTLDIAEVGEHIRQGKLPTQLALTWNSRVSFVLTEGLALKKIKLLDVVLENRGPASADEGFDADVAITTGELRGLLPDLIEALGGPLEPQPAS